MPGQGLRIQDLWFQVLCRVQDLGFRVQDPGLGLQFGLGLRM